MGDGIVRGRLLYGRMKRNIILTASLFLISIMIWDGIARGRLLYGRMKRNILY